MIYIDLHFNKVANVIKKAINDYIMEGGILEDSQYFIVIDCHCSPCFITDIKQDRSMNILVSSHIHSWMMLIYKLGFQRGCDPVWQNDGYGKESCIGVKGIQAHITA